jgi:hypothetical protein
VITALPSTTVSIIPSSPLPCAPQYAPITGGLSCRTVHILIQTLHWLPFLQLCIFATARTQLSGTLWSHRRAFLQASTQHDLEISAQACDALKSDQGELCGRFSMMSVLTMRHRQPCLTRDAALSRFACIVIARAAVMRPMPRLYCLLCNFYHPYRRKQALLQATASAALWTCPRVIFMWLNPHLPH